MDIYAPLAERVGMHGFKNQLEDLAFAELNKDGRDSVLARLDFLRGQGHDLSERIIGELRQCLAEEGIAAMASGRMTTTYSVWRKMQRKNNTFEQLSDIMTRSEESAVGKKGVSPCRDGCVPDPKKKK